MEGNALDKLKEIDDESIDLIVTDPPYGYSFMNKDWDKAVVSTEVWKECLRVLKAGAFAFVMSAPRQDVLSRMIVNLQDAGFRTDFTSIYYSYASGFPKAANTFKMLQKRGNPKDELNGSYLGFQPKPAVEVILVVMKPLSEKSFVDQALKNGKGITWLDDCRIPFQNDDGWNRSTTHKQDIRGNKWNSATETYELPPQEANEKGRFPANLLVSDDALNDGKIRKKSGRPNLVNKIYNVKGNVYGKYNDTTKYKNSCYLDDVDSYSRFFDLDSWYNNRAQFIITPKASPSERNKGLEEIEPQNKRIVNNQNCKYCPICNRKYPNSIMICKCGYNKLEITEVENKARSNYHPTVKPLKLMSYLITMGSRENDIVLDPFCGSGTTLIAAHLLNRRWIGIELNTEYAAIARKRIEPYLVQQKLL